MGMLLLKGQFISFPIFETMVGPLCERYKSSAALLPRLFWNLTILIPTADYV